MMFVGRFRQSISRTKSRAIPACIGGWNKRDSLATMDEKDAVILDNYFPDGTKTTQRAGSRTYSTGMSGDVNSLMVYSPLDGVQEMYAANGQYIYDVTSTGAVGAAVASGYSSDKWQTANMGTAGGQFLLGFNGVDTPFLYNGTTWGNTTITGPTVTSLIWGTPHQNRLWVGEKDSLSVWYGGVNSIGGAFTEFPLYSVAKGGGYIAGMASWTRDGGDGVDDVAVFFTSEGEAIIYSGSDPSTSGLWALVGVFKIGRPIGRRFWVKSGGDIIVVTEDGFVSLARILGADRANQQKNSISDKINLAVNDAVASYKANFGWEATIYTAGKMMMFNIPISSTESHQYVFNLITNAACRFTGLNAISFAIKEDELFFSTHNGTVKQADTGISDDGVNIEGDVFPAFSYFGSPQLVKSFQLAEAVYEGDIEIIPSKQLNTDFNVPSFAASETEVVYGDSAVWDTSKWDDGIWGGGLKVFRRWKSAVGIGRSASLRIKTATNKTRPSIIAINYIYKDGGLLR